MRLLLILFFIFFTHLAKAEGLPKAQQFTLDNGLNVLVIPNHKIPAVTHMIWYHIGGSDEEEGKTGLAHYLEHLMFKATENLQAGEFSRLVAFYGGSDNAFTSKDYTTYHQTIPKKHLPLVMLLEAERMQSLQLDEATSLKERDVILEERSMRVDNKPHSLLSEKMTAALFGNQHPYGIPVIGWRKDIESLTPHHATAFYHRYYAPNNATLVVAGDVTAEEVQQLAQQYYGHLQPHPNLRTHARSIFDTPLSKESPKHPIILQDKNVEQQQWIRYTLAPSYSTACYQQDVPCPTIALSVAAYILGGGETSRLYQSLVIQQKLATSASVYYDEMSLGNSIFTIAVTPNDGISMQHIESAVDKEIQHLIEQGLTDNELSRTITLLKAEAIYAQDSLENMAYIYGEAATTRTDLDYIAAWPDLVQQVSNTDVTNALTLVFQHPRTVIGYLLPDKEITPE